MFAYISKAVDMRRYCSHFHSAKIFWSKASFPPMGHTQYRTSQDAVFYCFLWEKLGRVPECPIGDPSNLTQRDGACHGVILWLVETIATSRATWLKVGPWLNICWIFHCFKPNASDKEPVGCPPFSLLVFALCPYNVADTSYTAYTLPTG